MFLRHIPPFRLWYKMKSFYLFVYYLLHILCRGTCFKRIWWNVMRWLYTCTCILGVYNNVIIWQHILEHTLSRGLWFKLRNMFVIKSFDVKWFLHILKKNNVIIKTASRRIALSQFFPTITITVTCNHVAEQNIHMNTNHHYALFLLIIFNKTKINFLLRCDSIKN